MDNIDCLMHLPSFNDKVSKWPYSLFYSCEYEPGLYYMASIWHFLGTNWWCLWKICVLTFNFRAVTMLIITSVQGSRLHCKTPWRVWFTPHHSLDWMVSKLLCVSCYDGTFDYVMMIMHIANVSFSCVVVWFQSGLVMVTLLKLVWTLKR